MIHKKKEKYKLHSEICKAFSCSTRQKIIDSLRHCELTVKDISAKTGIQQSSLSQHLAFLRTNGIVSSRKAGTLHFYSVTNPKIHEAFDLMSEVIHERLSSQQETLQSTLIKK